MKIQDKFLRTENENSHEICLYNMRDRDLYLNVKVAFPFLKKNLWTYQCGVQSTLPEKLFIV